MQMVKVSVTWEMLQWNCFVRGVRKTLHAYNRTPIQPVETMPARAIPQTINFQS